MKHEQPLTASARHQVELLRSTKAWPQSARVALWSRIEASARTRSTRGSLVPWAAVTAAIAIAVIALLARSRGDVAARTRFAIVPSAPAASPASRASSPGSGSSREPAIRPENRTVRVAGAAPPLAHADGHQPHGPKPRARVTGSSSQFAASTAAATPVTTDTIELPILVMTFEQCAALATTPEQQACYVKAAAGDGLEAGNALYALAVLDRDVIRDRAAATRALREYQHRFPEGLLGPEVALAIVAELRRDRCNTSALEELEKFLRRYPGDARAANVERLRATLARGPATGC